MHLNYVLKLPSTPQISSEFDGSDYIVVPFVNSVIKSIDDFTYCGILSKSCLKSFIYFSVDYQYYI